MPSKIFVKGARENNLKNIDVEIPRDALTVITGLSGSGKSSLAFDTIYAEGQRRYVESLSSYARMFLGQKEKPDVDYIEGLSPAISIDQKTTSQNPRSTVGTVTEVYDYLRLLWARVGTPHCPNCGKEIRQQSIDQIIDQLMALGEGTRIQVMAPVIRGKKGEYAKVFEDARKSGYVRVRVDGSMYDLSEEIKLEKNIKHSIEVVVDRLILKPDVVHRLSDSAETAAALSGGLVLINVLNPEQDILFSQNYACEDCGVSIEELTPRMFSFNNPFGACPACTGLGSQLKVDPELVIPNKTLSILDGAICASGWNNVRGDGISRMYFDALSKKYHFSLREPVEKLSPEVMDVILYGTKGEKLELHYDQPRGKGVLYQPFEGIVNNLERRYQETQSESVRAELEECMSECPCPACQGRRLRRESLAVTVGGMDIDAFTRMSVTEEIAFVDSLALTEQQLRIGERILKEIKNRLGFLQSVGLDYLTLSRASATLSGGESQRIRLATQIGVCVLLYLVGERLAVGDHLLKPHLTYDLTHVAFQYLPCDAGYVLHVAVKEVLLRLLDYVGIGRYLDVYHRVNGDVDVIRSRDCLGGLDVNGHQGKLQHVAALEERQFDSRLAYNYLSLAPQTAYDERLIRRSLAVASAENDDHQYNDDHNWDEKSRFDEIRHLNTSLCLLVFLGDPRRFVVIFLEFAEFLAALAVVAGAYIVDDLLSRQEHSVQPDVSGKTLERMRREKHLLIVLALSGGGKLQHHAVRRIKELIQIFQKHAFAVHEMLYHILDVKTNAVPLVAEFFCNHNLSPL